MISLDSALAHWGPGGLDLVVHVGAGRGDELDRYAALAVGRVVLVEGDAQAAMALREAAAGRAGVEVVERVVSVDGAEAEWNRYNLPALNGLADALDTRHIFPRLRRESILRVRTTTLEALMAAVSLPAAGRSALVLDMHGIDARLLDLADELLQRFEGILLRGSVRPADAVAGRLRAAGFAADPSADGDALWPVQRWTFDRVAFEQARLRRRAQDSEAALRASRDELASVRARLTADLDATRRAAEEARVASLREQEAAKERSDLQVTEARLAQQRCRELEAQLQRQADDHERAARSAELRLAQELDAQALLERQGAELASTASAHRARIEALEAALADAQGQAAAQAADIDTLRRQGAEQAQQGQAAQAGFERERVQQAAAVSMHLARIDELAAALSAAEHRAAAQAADIETLRRQGVAQDQQRLDSQASFDRERDELGSAVATHLARIDELAAALSGAQDRAVAQAADIETLRQQAAEQAWQAQAAQANSDRERAELATMVSTHTARVELLVGKLTAADVKVAAQSSEIEALRGKSGEQARHTQESQATFERERGELALAVAAHLARIDELATALSRAQARDAGLSEDVETLRRQAAEQAQHQQAAQAKFDREQADLAAMVATHAARIELLVGKLTAADVKVAAQLAEIEALRGKNAELARLAEEARVRFDRERAELAAAATRQLAQVDALTATLSDAQSKAQAQSGDIEKLGRRVADQEGERAELAAAAASHASRIDALGASLAEAERKAAAQLDELEALRKKAAAQDKQQRDLEHLLQDRHARISVYAEKLSALEREREAALKREQLLRDEVLQAEAQIELIKDVVLRESES